MLGVVLTWRMWTATPEGRQQWDRTLLQLPRIGPLTLKIETDQGLTGLGDGLTAETASLDARGNRTVSRTLIDKQIGTLTLFAFDDGQGLSEHTAPYDAFVQIVDGAADITIGGEDHRVAAGQMIIMPANVPHALRAAGKFKMLLVMIRA